MGNTSKSLLIAFLLAAMPGFAPTANATRRRAVEPPTPLIQPVAVADQYLIGQGGTLTVFAPGVLGNDTVGSASIFSYGATTGAEQTTIGQATPTSQHGSVTLNADGRCTYIPPAGFSGTDTFRYVIKNSVGSSTATVTFTVSPIPVAVDDMYNATKDTPLTIAAPGVIANDMLNGATITSYGVTGTEQATLGSNTATARGGVVALSADGHFNYGPPTGFTGNDSFRYTIHAVSVGLSTATVTINVQAVQQPGNADFFVTSPGFFYTFEGMADSNPELTLVRGRTYTFEINTDFIHPFEIINAPPGSVTNNNISAGILTFTVPNTNASYMYICSIHGFGNTIHTTP